MKPQTVKTLLEGLNGTRPPPGSSLSEMGASLAGNALRACADAFRLNAAPAHPVNKLLRFIHAAQKLDNARKLLQLTPFAAPEEIKRALRLAMRSAHPDVSQSDPETARKLLEARDLLLDHALTIRGANPPKP